MKNNANFDLYIDEGLPYSIYLALERVVVDDFGKETATPVDLSDIDSIYAQVRPDFDTSSIELLNFEVEVSNAIGGEIFLNLPAGATAHLDLDVRFPVIHLGYYDIILQSKSGARSKLVSGKVMINQTVTTPDSVVYLPS